MLDIRQGGTLGDFAGLQRGTTYKSKLLGTEGPWLLGLACIARNGGFKADNLKTYGGPSDPKILVGPGDILVSLKDVTQAADLLGSVVTVPDSIGQGRLTQDTVKLVFDDDFSERNYIYWLLRTPQARDHCRRHATGTTNLGLAREDFLAIEVPPLDEGRQNLLQVLQALDDKIDLSRRMNETLEAQARALFRDWFVDFGPVKAKMAGPDAGGAPYLAPDLRSLFPNRLDDDGVPEGWSYSTIGAEVDAVGGSTPSTKNAEFWEGDIAWTTPKDLSGLNSPILLETSRRITSAGLAKIGSGLLPAGTVLLSSRAPVGYLAITQIPLAVNQGYIAMRCEGRISNYFAYLWAKENMDLILQNANGSTFQEISKKNFRPLPVIVAEKPIHRQFDNMVEPLFEKIVANELENRTLAKTRDLLLPKLMSGEIRVGEAEREIERV